MKTFDDTVLFVTELTRKALFAVLLIFTIVGVIWFAAGLYSVANNQEPKVEITVTLKELAAAEVAAKLAKETK